MRAAWTAFATDGDPGWPAYDTQRLVQIFDTEPVVAPYPEVESRKIWQDFGFAALDVTESSVTARAAASSGSV